MKIFRRVLSVVLASALALSVGIIPPKSTVTTDAKVKIIEGKKLNITIGKKGEIIVKGKAKAKVASKKIAKVTKTKKQGKYTLIYVKGKKVGKTSVKVKVGKKSKKVKVSVVPAKTTLKSATLTADTTAKLTWGKAKGASGYYVYRSTSYSSGYKKIATVKGGSKTFYINTGLSLGVTYYYKVRTYGAKSLKSKEDSAVKKVKTWKLTWSDEFNGTELDTTKWNNEGATGDGGYGNQELQNYQMEYSEVNDGCFIIKPQFDYNAATGECVDKRYFSTKIWTKGQHYFGYGKFEFRAKMPKGCGTWAAGWMLGKNMNWPYCGEIDVFETTKQPEKTKIPMSVHTGKFNGMPTSKGNKYGNAIVPTATTAFHTYTVIRNEKTLDFYVDGKYIWTYDPSMYTTQGDGTDDYMIWPFNQDMYLILNCAIGGTLGGDVAPTYWTKIATSGNIETYQDKMYVDYVRYYK